MVDFHLDAFHSGQHLFARLISLDQPHPANDPYDLTPSIKLNLKHWLGHFESS